MWRILMVRRKWTPVEDQLIIDNFSTGLKYCAKLVNRSYSATRNRSRLLGLSKFIPKTWQLDEVNFLIKNYQEFGLSYCAKYLNRTKSSVQNMATRHNLCKSIHKFTKKDKDFLIINYKKHGAQYCADALNADKSKILYQAKQLNLIYSNKWKQKEINILKQYYSDNPEYCYLSINRSKKSIQNKAQKLKIKIKNKITDNDIKNSFDKSDLVLLENVSPRDIKKKTRCFCGKIFYTNIYNVYNQNTKSCGCLKIKNTKIKLRKNLIGFKQNKGKLEVISFSHINKSRQSVWNCRCECGNTTKVSVNNVQNESVASCGNCGFYRNGIATSKVSLNLHDILIKNNFQTKEEYHNYFTDGFYIDMVILDKDIKIAIEYNGAFWHSGSKKQKRDRQKYKKLLSSGWKLLIIYGAYSVPETDIVKQAISKLYNSSNYEEIIMDEWNDPKFHEKGINSQNKHKKYKKRCSHILHLKSH